MGNPPDDDVASPPTSIWLQMGAALASVGATVATGLGALGAAQHLWQHPLFLAGFVAACLAGAGGLYLILSFVLPLPLPTRLYGPEGSRRVGDSENSIQPTRMTQATSQPRRRDPASRDQRRDQQRTPRGVPFLALTSAVALSIAAGWFAAMTIRAL
jgi:hypothetical protein